MNPLLNKSSYRIFKQVIKNFEKLGYIKYEIKNGKIVQYDFFNFCIWSIDLETMTAECLWKKIKCKVKTYGNSYIFEVLNES